MLSDADLDRLERQVGGATSNAITVLELLVEVRRLRALLAGIDVIVDSCLSLEITDPEAREALEDINKLTCREARYAE